MSLTPSLAGRPALLLLTAALTGGLLACDASGPAAPDAGPPDAVQPLSPDHEAVVAQAFAEVEDLFDLGFAAGDAAPSGAAAGARTGLHQALAVAAAQTDTTTYTGAYDAVNAKGYLLTLQYREPQGVGVWQARVQHARAVPASGGGTLDAVETVTLTFLDFASLDAFVGTLEDGSNAYLVGASDDPEAAFFAFDTWRVAQVYSPAEGEAVVSYGNAELRETVTVREPVVTRNADGSGTVRDGGAGGAVRTRYYGADFAVSDTGDVSGTLLRTLTSSGSVATGAILSRTDYPDGSWRQTEQVGGDGVVIRTNSQG